MYPEETTHWGHSAYQNGQLLYSGPNPIDDEIRESATEFRWIKTDPTLVIPEVIEEE